MVRKIRHLQWLAIMGITSVALSGCVSGPKWDDYAAKPDYTLDISDEHRVTTSFIRRRLYNYERQKELTARALNQQIENSGGQSTYFHNDARLIGDAISGSWNSGLGIGLGVGIAVLDAFADDGSSKYVSGVILSETYNGVKIDSASTARSVIVDETVSKLELIAKTYGWALSCEFDCIEHNNAVYRMAGTGNPELMKNYIYQPYPILVRVSVGKFQEASEVEKEILTPYIGSEVKWVTVGAHAYVVELYSDHEYSDTKGIWNSPSENLDSNHIGRDMMRYVYSSKNLYHGMSVLGTFHFYHGGNYHYNSKGYTLETPLLPVTPVHIPPKSETGLVVSES